jgi:hypothetical protein
MKKTILLSASCLLAALPFTAFSQQNSGVVTYQMTMQRPGGGSQNADNADDAGDNGGGGNVFTMNRTFTFNANGGKLSSPDFGGGNMMPSRRRSGGDAADNGGGSGDRPQGDRMRGGRGRGEGPGGSGGRGGFRGGRGGNAEYVNFADKQYIRAFKQGNSDTTFYVTEDYLKPENFQTTTKTKKIAGYNCHKATAQWHKQTYTIWYTTDIPVNYSPINGLTPPDGGFVLDLQSDRMEYKATKVDLKAVADDEVKIPEPSEQLSQEQVQARRQQMRDQMRERMRNRNSQGGGNQ